MEIKKITKHEPKYPAADIAKKLGAAAAAAALIAGCVTGCRPAEEISQLSGDVPYYAPDDELNESGDVIEYAPDDEYFLSDSDENCVSCSEISAIDVDEGLLALGGDEE